MKKKIITVLLMAGLVLASFTACSDNSDKKDGKKDGVTEENATPEKAQYTMMEKQFPISFKSNDGEETYVTGTIRKASVVAHDRVGYGESAGVINDRLTTAYERNKQSSSGLTDAVVSAFKSENFDEEKANFPWTMNTEYELIRNDGLVLTFKEKVDIVAGETNVANVYYYNFNAKSGTLIEQLIYPAGDDKARDEVEEVIYKKLCDKYGTDTISYDNVASSFAEASVDCWHFTDDGIVITYNVGDIAKEDAGVLEIELSKDELIPQATQYFLDK